jgi:uncharacterized BrkB/YihY/UPF0761 family membrane protein
MTYIALFALVMILSIGFSLLSIASDQDDVDNNTDFR